MLIESKSNLAKLMATENIIVEQRNVPTAYFNLGSRTLVIPTLKNELSSTLYDLFIGHEVGHALNTPEDGWHDSIKEMGVNRSILNVCEDVRIEKLIRRKFPGLKMSFIKAYRELLDQDFFDVKGKDLNVLKFIDRVNLHTKCGASLGIKFDMAETPLLRLAEDAETFEQTVEAAKKIQAFMKEQMEERQAKSGGDGDTPEDEGESGPSTDIGDEDGDDMDFGDNDDATPNGEMADQQLESDTDKAFREKEKDLYQNDPRGDSSYANLPIFDASKLIVDYKEIYSEIRRVSNTLDPKDLYEYEKHAKIDTSLFAKFRQESNKVVGYLTKEFELRKNADQMKKASVAKTGDLNMNRIFSYQFSEDIFKKISVVPNGKSHGLVLFLDWSGSMHNVMHDTIKQLLSLVLFCKKVSIPFEVYAFSDAYSKGGDNPYWDNDLPIVYKDGDLLLRNVTLMNILSSRMNSVDLSFAGSALLSKVYDVGYYGSMRLGGTPLNETITAAMDLIPKFQKKYKLQVVNTVFLTDGEGHGLNRIQNAAEVKRISNIVLRDPVTSASMRYNLNATDNSKAFLFLLKQRTGCNIIGFRIISARNAKEYLYKAYNGADIEPILNEFRKTKSTVIKSAGFDEYYLLREDKMSTDEDDELQVKSTTTRGLVSAFKNYTKGHIQNRVILNRFIGLIS
jgi:hypothetical protein